VKICFKRHLFYLYIFSVSAFYAEHKKKKVSFCANVWTKSKFLGLSVAVHHVGQGIVRLLKHQEEYISTFPSGYGRFVLLIFLILKISIFFLISKLIIFVDRY